MKFIYNAFFILKIVIFILWLFFTLDILILNITDSFNIYSIIICILGYIPIIIINALYKNTENIKISKIIGFMFIFILYLFFVVLEILFWLVASIPIYTNSITPSKLRYPSYISKMTDKTYRISHFPLNIPKGAKNYYFIIDREDLFGYYIHYLKFQTNNEYIKKIIEKHKNDIFEKINKEDVDKYYRFIPIDKMEYKEHIHTYILKNKNQDNDYTSGIITSSSGEILFFYANFNLSLR